MSYYIILQYVNINSHQKIIRRCIKYKDLVPYELNECTRSK